METTPDLPLDKARAALETYIKVRNEIEEDPTIIDKRKANRLLRNNPQFALDQIKAALIPVRN